LYFLFEGEEFNLPDVAALPLGESSKPFPHYLTVDEAVTAKYI
jgi:hypothetical protein